MKQERLYSGDEVVYKGKFYYVTTANFTDYDGIQKIRLIRVADMESNRQNTLPSIVVRSNECKIINESNIAEIKKLRRKNR